MRKTSFTGLLPYAVRFANEDTWSKTSTAKETGRHGNLHATTWGAISLGEFARDGGNSTGWIRIEPEKWMNEGSVTMTPLGGYLLQILSGSN